MSDNRPRFPSVDRRINYLRQELYNYDKYFRDPTSDIDIGRQAKFSIDAEEHQAELDELMYLRELAEMASAPTGIKRWQAVLVIIYSTVALIIAGLALWHLTT